MTELEPNVGIVGTHVRHSLSPVMHNAAYREMGVDLRYGIFEVPELQSEDVRKEFFDAFLRMQSEIGIVGMSVTMPFKEDITTSIEVRAMSKSATEIGAANTLSNLVSGNWYADNTDWVGVVESIEEAGIDIDGKTALIIGAGGTARAVAYGLGKRKAHQVIVANRTEANAVSLASDLQPVLDRTHVNPYGLEHIFPRLDEGGINLAKNADIVFNTTLIGQDGTQGEDRLPVSSKIVEHLKSGAVVEDAVYMPLETPFLRTARERSDLIVIDGTRMLLLQAVEQVRIFTGETDIPIDAMSNALAQEIARRQNNSV